jgi:SAM-dependent methyltransferase
VSLARKGRALDLAAGNGRNARFLAERGFIVHAVDISNVALAPLAGLHPGLHPICADLDHFDIAVNSYDLIVNIRFLHRRLFPQIYEGLRPGGVLIFESYVMRAGEPVDRCFCPDYLLRENELLQAFIRLNVRYYRDRAVSDDDHGRRPAYCAGLVAVKPTHWA